MYKSITMVALMSDMVYGDMFSELKSGGFGYGLGVSVLCNPANGFNYFMLNNHYSVTYLHTYIHTDACNKYVHPYILHTYLLTYLLY